MAGSTVDWQFIFHWLQLLDSFWRHPFSKWCLDSLSLRIFVPVQNEHEVLSKGVSPSGICLFRCLILPQKQNTPQKHRRFKESNLLDFPFSLSFHLQSCVLERKSHLIYFSTYTLPVCTCSLLAALLTPLPRQVASLGAKMSEAQGIKLF